eukprot:scaffold3502_cov183-Amphora_coffeaeformis.AAC.6
MLIVPGQEMKERGKEMAGEDPEDDVLMKGEGLEKCQARGDMGSKPLPALQSSMMDGDSFESKLAVSLAIYSLTKALARIVMRLITVRSEAPYLSPKCLKTRDGPGCT